MTDFFFQLHRHWSPCQKICIDRQGNIFAFILIVILSIKDNIVVNSFIEKVLKYV